MKKKKQLLLCTAALLLLLTACGNQDPGNGQTAPEPETTQSDDTQTMQKDPIADDSDLQQEESESLENQLSDENDDENDFEDAENALENTASSNHQIAGGRGPNDAVTASLDEPVSGKTTDGTTQWFSFTTGTTGNGTYRVTLVNQTRGAGTLKLQAYDTAEKAASDSNLPPLIAEANGTASTIDLELPPDTTCYLKIWSNDGKELDYTFTVWSPAGQQNMTGRPSPEPSDDLQIPASIDQYSAQLIPLNTRLEGTVHEDQGQWFAFTTNSVENATYKVTIINRTRGSEPLNLQVYDVYGVAQPNASSTPIQATQTGRAVTSSLELPPNTTYYVFIWAKAGDTIDYTLNVHAPEQPAAQP